MPRLQSSHRRIAVTVTTLLLAACFFPLGTHAVGSVSDGPTGNCTGPFAPLLPNKAPSAPGETNIQAQEPTVRFAWPLALPFSDRRLRIANYFDHDPLPGVLDYMGGDLAYNGHVGTDFALNSFRDMDAGVPVLAAANGRVIYVEDRNYDREITAPDVPGNGVYVLHQDGTISIYWHLRTNSITVRVGEYVREGQMIGLMGSAGMTLLPHLHFQVETPTRSTGLIDPWSGTRNPIPSLWKQQEDYVGDDHLVVHDLGVATGSAFYDVGGLDSWSAFKYRPSQPAIFGADEPILKVWVLVTGQTSEPYSIEIYRPDGSLYGRQEFAVPTNNYGQTWQYWDLPFVGTVTPAEFGEWNARVVFGVASVASTLFTVGETSRYAPRFHWVGGRSFHLSSGRQEDILSLSFLGSPIEELTFALENAPSNVSLTTDDAGQTKVLIDPAGPDLAGVRSREFAVVATDPYGLQDRMHYHLVNDAAGTLGSPPAVVANGVVSASEEDTVVVEVFASDADGDSIAALTANLSGLPPGNKAVFTADPGNTHGRLVWPTAVDEEGTYRVTFTALTSLGAVPSWGYTPTVQFGSATTSIEIRATRPTTLQARAFITGHSHPVPLVPTAHSSLCVEIEPVGGAYQNEDLDPSTVVMRSDSTGSVSEIQAIAGKSIRSGDRDRNGVAELQFCFRQEALAALFSGSRGRTRVTAHIAASLRSGARVVASLELDVITTGGHLTAQIYPNPFNPAGTLGVLVSRPGPLRVSLFDVSGRIVRRLVNERWAGAGLRQIPIDAGSGREAPLASGIYFYRVESSGESITGRFAVAK